MLKDDWAETVMIIVAAVVLVVLMVALVKRGIVYGAERPQQAAQCFRPYISGEAAPMKEELLPERHGDCMRILVYSLWSACEKQEGEDRATCYSYFMVPGRVECKPVSCAGGVVQPKGAL